MDDNSRIIMDSHDESEYTIKKNNKRVCPKCDGMGELLILWVIPITCYKCRGTGLVIKK